MISYKRAKEILAKYIKDPRVIKHSEGVSDFAFMLAEKIKRNHPELKINKDKIRIAALLHDIGKEHQEGHEERSLDILRKEGLKDIAKISRHGLLYLKEIENKNNSNLTEKIENKIVVYSDIRFKFFPMTAEERLKEGKTGWRGTPKEISLKMKYIRSLILKLEEEIFVLVGEEI